MSQNKGQNKLIFEGSKEALEYIQYLFESGALSEILGVQALNLDITSASQPVSTPSKTAEEQEEFAKTLLRLCRRQGYSWVELSQIRDVIQQAYQTTQEAIDTAFRKILFPDSIAGVTKSNKDNENSEINSEEDVELDTEFLNSLIEQVIKFYKIH